MANQNNESDEIYSKDDLDRIASTLPQFVDPRRSQLELIMQYWVSWHQDWLQEQEIRLPAKDVRKQLGRLQRDLSRLTEDYEATSAEVINLVLDQLWVSKHFVELTGGRYLDKLSSMDRIVATLMTCRDAIDEAGRTYGTGRGRRGDMLKKMAALELGEIYLYLTGERPTRRVKSGGDADAGSEYGPFREFLIAALEPIYNKEIPVNLLVRYAAKSMEQNDTPAGIINAIIAERENRS